MIAYKKRIKIAIQMMKNFYRYCHKIKLIQLFLKIKPQLFLKIKLIRKMIKKMKKIKNKTKQFHLRMTTKRTNSNQIINNKKMKALQISTIKIKINSNQSNKKKTLK